MYSSLFKITLLLNKMFRILYNRNKVTSKHLRETLSIWVNQSHSNISLNNNTKIFSLKTKIFSLKINNLINRMHFRLRINSLILRILHNLKTSNSMHPVQIYQ
uniref:Uncharacterized protein n=1 Tax=Cacopsylla melanoneura TaxID=428564 RepID=A0A8D8U0C4_9HEMI